jgi:hypothetical protein
VTLPSNDLQRPSRIVFQTTTPPRLVTETHIQRVQTVAICALIGLFSLAMLNARGTSDVPALGRWVDHLREQGLVAGFASLNELYPPLSLALLHGLYSLGLPLGIGVETVIKWNSAVCFALSVLIFYAWTRDAVVTGLFYLATLLNGVALTYSDSLYTPTLLIALWALSRRRLVLFSVCFTLSVFIKWQPLLLAPFVLIYLMDIDTIKQWRRIPFRDIALRVVAPAALITAGVFAYFGPATLEAFSRSFHNNIFSGRALNLSWVITYALRVVSPEVYGELDKGEVDWIIMEDPSVAVYPKLLFAALFLFCLYRFFRSPKTFETFLLYSFTGFITYFVMNTGVHENHLYIAVILAALRVWLNRAYYPMFLTWAIVANLNLVLFYGLDGRGLRFSRVVGGLDLSLVMALVILLLYLFQYVSNLHVSNLRVLAPPHDETAPARG